MAGIIRLGCDRRYVEGHRSPIAGLGALLTLMLFSMPRDVIGIIRIFL